MGFNDFDGDGLLDVFLCHFTIGHVGEIHPISHEASRNQILFNRGNGFEATDLPCLPGETHGVLVTDFNDDGRHDFVCYNDWTVSDMYYIGQPDGSFHRLESPEEMVPQTGWDTMSIRSADVDNDLVPELYITQVSGHEDEGAGLDIQIPLAELENHAESEHERQLIRKFEQNLKIFGSENHMLFAHFIPEELRQDWMAYQVVRRAAEDMDRNYAALVPEHRRDVHMFIERIASEHTVLRNEQRPGEIPQNRDLVNLLLKRDASTNRFTDRGKEFGLQNAGWTWNASFADVNNDEFQDLYIATGFFQFHLRDNNVFFLNRGGQRFDQVTDEYGLTDYLSTSAFTHTDFDRDGDMDIISLPVTMANVRFFQNQGPKGNSITIQLRDLRGNRFAIGSRIIVRYGESKHQLREISASGGYLSFEPQEAHFGLGEHTSIREIEIRWPDNTRTALKGDFEANQLYRIHRN